MVNSFYLFEAKLVVRHNMASPASQVIINGEFVLDVPAKCEGSKVRNVALPKDFCPRHGIIALR